MWKVLLVPHDFSPSAEHAMQVAVGLAKVQGAAIALLHVSDLPGNVAREALVTHGGVSLRADEYAIRGALDRLEAIANPVRRDGIDVRTYATAGDVADEIVSAAGELLADAVVMGTHGRTGLSHLLLGSVAEKVIRHASIPVVILRSRGPEAQPTREERRLEDELAG